MLQIQTRLCSSCPFLCFKACKNTCEKKEFVNCLTDPHKGRSTLRPADVVVYGWVGGKHACARVDLTGVLSLAGLRARILLWDRQPLKLLQVKWPNVIKHYLIVRSCFHTICIWHFLFLSTTSCESSTKSSKSYE
jgi:hypothetical protein